MFRPTWLRAHSYRPAFKRPPFGGMGGAVTWTAQTRLRFGTTRRAASRKAAKCPRTPKLSRFESESVSGNQKAKAIVDHALRFSSRYSSDGFLHRECSSSTAEDATPAEYSHAAGRQHRPGGWFRHHGQNGVVEPYRPRSVRFGKLHFHKGSIDGSHRGQ